MLDNLIVAGDKTIVMRLGLAVLQAWHLRPPGPDGERADLAQMARGFRQSEDLMQACWSYPVSQKDLHKLYTSERPRCRAAMQQSGRNLGVNGEATYKVGFAATALLVSPSSILEQGPLKKKSNQFIDPECPREDTDGVLSDPTHRPTLTGVEATPISVVSGSQSYAMLPSLYTDVFANSILILVLLAFFKGRTLAAALVPNGCHPKQ